MNWFDIMCLWLGRFSFWSFTLIVCWLLCNMKDLNDKGTVSIDTFEESQKRNGDMV